MENKDKLRSALLKSAPAKPRGRSNMGHEELVTAPIEGQMTIEKIYADGSKEIVLQEKNLVVRLAESIMAAMSVGLRQFSYIELGDPSPAGSPTLDDINLQQTTGERKAVTQNTVDNTVTLTAEWGLAEGNGFNYTEAGLFSTPFGSGYMFARKIFAAVSKDASFSLKITWAIVFRISLNDGCTGVALMGNSAITQDYEYVSATGGESQITVSVDFVVGTRQLDVFLNGVRLAYGTNYTEVAIGLNKGVQFSGFTLIQDDRVYVVKRSLA